MDAYCFKCRAKREIRNPQRVTLKNGRPATQGPISLLEFDLLHAVSEGCGKNPWTVKMSFSRSVTRML